MKYYKYTSIKVGETIIKLDPLNYKRYYKEYIIDYTEDSLPIYIVILSIDPTDVSSFVAKQRVQLEEISKDTFYALRGNSVDYRTIREFEKKERDTRIFRNMVGYRDTYFDANDRSIDRIASRLSYYNYMFNRKIANGSSVSSAYEIYNDKIKWRDSDGIEVELTIKELADLMYRMIESVENIVKSY